MQPITTRQDFMLEKEFKDLSQNHEIVDFLDLEENGLFVSYTDDTLLDKDHKVSIGIASAVTSYARIYMTQFKNNSNYKLYYTDTDSLFISGLLSKELIGNELGKFKLEYVFKEAVFLGPKLYAGVTIDDQYICKVKGYKYPKSIPFTELKKLLNKSVPAGVNGLELRHDKWFKSLSDGTITIKEQIYNLISTENKRKLIRDDSGKIIKTKPFKINK